MKHYILLFFVGILFFGCQEPLQVGSKKFTEQLILSEIIAQLAEQQNIPVKRLVPYGDTRDCIESLRNKHLDVYVEYTGTGLMILGQPSLSDAEKSFEIVQKQFGEMQIDWQPRLGFANNYVLVMRRDWAVSHHISCISDLAKFENVKIGCDASFVTRPLDGFAAMLRRYGIATVKPALVEDDKSIMYRALLDKKIDVAVGYTTDGQIEAFDLQILPDDLEFFPVYQAAPIVHSKALKQFPKLQKVFSQLSGLIDAKAMREMNRRVELDGESYKDIASEFIEQQKLLTNPRKIKKSQYRELVFAIGTDDELGGIAGKAQHAIRKTFPGRRLKIVRSDTPEESVIQNQARLALVGAESFFDLSDPLKNRRHSLEAVAPIGYRMCHVLVRSDANIKDFSQIKTVGTGNSGSSSQQIANILLQAFQLKEVELYNGELQQQLDNLVAKKLDCVVFMMPIGDSRLTAAMDSGNLQLLDLHQWKKLNLQFRFPFLRLSRIAANTYHNQNQVIETLSSQVVLAGPAILHDVIGDAGPMTAVYSKAQPLSDSSVTKLNKELQTQESVDPILPAAKALEPKSAKFFQKSINSYETSLTNVIVIIALIYLAFLFLREDEEIEE